MQKRISVVILNWNGEKMMKKFLPSVVKYSKGAEVVVADNASSDNSIEMLTKEFPDVRQILLDRNYGFAEGYNRAIAEISTEYVVLLNSDVEVEEGWLDAMTQYMDKHNDVAACQPKLMAYHDKGSFEYSGAAGGFIDCYGYPFCRGRIFGYVEHDTGQYDENCEIHWATGACMMVRKKVFEECGGFDSRFFAHNEEIDLCWRMRLYGYKIMCIPESKVYHVGGGTLPQGNPRKVYLNFRNNLTMLYKNLPQKRLKRVMLIRQFLDSVAVVQCLVKGDVYGARAIMRARKDFKAWRGKYAEIREGIQRRRAIKDDMTTSYCVLYQHFLFRKTRFSQLKG